ncbi:MAG: hypothetical protein MUQ65_07940, partial [Armatimonadetes bacterium]|nr:hypothetical protein [Armatimonadota bacterium]
MGRGKDKNDEARARCEGGEGGAILAFPGVNRGIGMQVRIAARITVWALLALGCISTAWGDTLVVRGHRVRSPARFEVVGDEVYVPLLDGLEYLDASHEVTAEAVRIETASGHDVVVYRKRPEGTRDGVLREMPGP